MWIEQTPNQEARTKVLRRMCDLLHIPGLKPLHAICDLDAAVFVGEVISALPALGYARARRLELMLHGILATEPAFCVLLGICRLRAKKYEAARRAFAKAVDELELTDPSLLKHAHRGWAEALIALGEVTESAPHFAQAQMGSTQVAAEDSRPPRGLRLLRIGAKSARRAVSSPRPVRRASVSARDLVASLQTT